MNRGNSFCPNVKTFLFGRPLFMVHQGIRNGFVYGVRIRAPHAFVMSVLFRGGSLWSQLVSTFWMSWAHGKNLGKFCGVYKFILLLLDHIKGANSSLHSFIAGGLGGYLIWGEDSSVNRQITLYCFARVCTGLAQSLNDPKGPMGRIVLPNPLGQDSNRTYPVFAVSVQVSHARPHAEVSLSCAMS